MPDYRRMFIPGGTWFFTVNLLDRRLSLLVEHIDELRQAFTKTKKQWPFKIDAIVILPDHLHAILTLPEDDINFSVRWQLIKSHFSKSISHEGTISPSRQRRKERTVWQRRFWEHYIRDENDFQQHLDYCYFNPVKHGYVNRVQDWPYSSFHKDVRDGLISKDWAGDIGELKIMGER
ncbi:MAG: REP-associated tyrosine transposase [Methyloligellaceae bacterium]